MSTAPLDLLTLPSKDGTTLVVERHGSGPALLLVHGTTAQRSRWQPILPRLAQHYHVHTLDRRGRGDSGDADTYTLAREFEDIATVIHQLGPDTPIVAHSYGAICALGGANLAGHTGTLVLYEPPIGHLVDPAVIDCIQASSDAGDLDASLSTFLAEVLHLPATAIASAQAREDWRRRVRVAPTIARELRALHELGATPEALARERTAKVELLLGGDSIDAFRRATDFLTAHLPQSQVHLLPGQQHQAIDTAPALFLDTILPLLPGTSNTRLP